MKKLVIIVFFIQLIGCDTVTRKLKLVNNSDETRYSIIMLDTTLDKYVSQSLTKISPHHFVLPSLVAGKGEGVWEYTINNHSIDSTLYIYFFDTNQINDTIISERRYKRFDLKVKDLNGLHWTVNYK